MVKHFLFFKKKHKSEQLACQTELEHKIAELERERSELRRTVERLVDKEKNIQKELMSIKDKNSLLETEAKIRIDYDKERGETFRTKWKEIQKSLDEAGKYGEYIVKTEHQLRETANILLEISNGNLFDDFAPYLDYKKECKRLSDKYGIPFVTQ